MLNDLTLKTYKSTITLNKDDAATFLDTGREEMLQMAFVYSWEWEGSKSAWMESYPDTR
jgi:hypothetical protein